MAKQKQQERKRDDEQEQLAQQERGGEQHKGGEQHRSQESVKQAGQNDELGEPMPGHTGNKHRYGGGSRG